MRQRGDGRGRSLSFPWFWVGTDLKRLLQYLHGSVLGFWCRVSPFSSALLDGGDASIDCSGSIAHEKKRVCWGGQDSWGIGTHGGGTVTVQDTGQRRRSHLAPLGEWGKGEGGGVGGGRTGSQILRNTVLRGGVGGRQNGRIKAQNPCPRGCQSGYSALLGWLICLVLVVGG